MRRDALRDISITAVYVPYLDPNSHTLGKWKHQLNPILKDHR